MSVQKSNRPTRTKIRKKGSGKRTHSPVKIRHGHPGRKHSISFRDRFKALPLPWKLSAGLALCLAIYLLRLDRVGGEFVDDGWYMLLARALATGHGYTLINAPSPGIVPYYPPAFPALMSLVFHTVPEFPSNIFLLKAISIVAIFLAGGLTYIYFSFVKETGPLFAGGIAAATLLTPAIVFLATSTVMSECFFMLLQIATIVLLEKSLRVKDRRTGWLWLLMASASAGIALLTRSIAVGMLAAVVIYLLINRLFLKAICFSGVVTLIALPWLVYSSRHAPTVAQANEQKFITQNYMSQLLPVTMTSAQSAVSQQPETVPRATHPQGSGIRQWSPVSAASDLLRRGATNLTNIGTKSTGRLLFAPLYRAPRDSGLETLGRLVVRMSNGILMGTVIISLVLSGLCLWGFIGAIRRDRGLAELTVLLTLLIIFFWPGPPFRLLVPLTAFLIFYTVSGVQALAGAAERALSLHSPSTNSNPAKIAELFLFLIIGASLCDHVAYLMSKFHWVETRAGWIDRYEESQQLMRWLSANTDPATVVATENAPLVFLTTGLKTIPDLDPVTDREELRRQGAKIFAHISPYATSRVRLDDPRFHILYYTKQSNFYVLSLDP